MKNKKSEKAGDTKYKGFLIRTTENGTAFTSLIKKDNVVVGGTFSTPMDKQTSIEKAKAKIDSGRYDEGRILDFKIGDKVDYVLADEILFSGIVSGIDDNPEYKPYTITNEMGEKRYAHNDFLRKSKKA